MCPYNINLITIIKINLENLELLRPWGPQIQFPGLHDPNFNTHKIQTPRGQELGGHIKKEKQIMTAHEKDFRFHAQPQTGACSG